MKVNNTLFKDRGCRTKNSLWLKFVNTYLNLHYCSAILSEVVFWNPCSCLKGLDVSTEVMDTEQKWDIWQMLSNQSMSHFLYYTWVRVYGVVGAGKRGFLLYTLRWNTFKDHTLIIRGVLTEFSSLLSWTCPLGWDKPI